MNDIGDGAPDLFADQDGAQPVGKPADVLVARLPREFTNNTDFMLALGRYLRFRREAGHKTTKEMALSWARKWIPEGPERTRTLLETAIERGWRGLDFGWLPKAAPAATRPGDREWAQQQAAPNKALAEGAGTGTIDER